MNDEHMKEKLSALVDNELDELEERRVFTALGGDVALRRTGTLWFAIGFHAAYDFGETYVYSVPDSGFVMPGHLLASSFHGPAWLTGGTVGPEGSVFDFVIMAIVFVVFDRVYRVQKADPSLLYPSAR